MRTIAEFLIASMDLVRAESKEVGRTGLRVVKASVFVLVGGFVVLIGFGFLVASCYLALATTMSAASAALLTGLIGLVLGVLLIVGSRWIAD